MLTKNALLAAAVVAIMSSASAARAEDAAPAAPPQKGGVEKAENFSERKAKVLERMAEREAEFQKRKACVQASTSHETLKACFPNRGHWGKKGPMDGHGGHDKGGKAPVKEGGDDAAPSAE